MEVSALTHASSVPGLRGPSPLLRLQSDERLIALTRRGQHAAFETLCARYQSRLLSFCRHLLGSREDAEDVLPFGVGQLLVAAVLEFGYGEPLE